jgi:hypothetical protein
MEYEWQSSNQYVVIEIRPFSWENNDPPSSEMALTATAVDVPF